MTDPQEHGLGLVLLGVAWWLCRQIERKMRAHRELRRLAEQHLQDR